MSLTISDSLNIFQLTVYSLMTILAVSKFGRIDENFLREVLGVVEECYIRFKELQPTLVDFYVFEKSSSMNAFLSKEKLTLGILTSNFEETFFATHDAWRGIPRIIICFEKMKNLPKLIIFGGLRHEAAHTILHGSPEYYLLVLSKSLRWAEKTFNLPEKIVNDIFYLISIAVKDYEVTKLLYEKGGYAEDQVEYCKHHIKPSFEEKVMWEIAKINDLAKILLLASTLKNLCCTAPLLKDKNYGLNVKEEVDKSLVHLPEKIKQKILGIVEETGKLNFNTHKNIEFLSKIFTEKILKPVLGKEDLLEC
ncbi:MAG: hypothetical protein N3E48_00615 [Candidatus Bathyarchaeota archaeon]|nr:hypothetical protein [Candidatus Bathyarchaeota archaeon]